MNILKGLESQKEVNPNLFCEEPERNLYQSFLWAKDKIDNYLIQRDYRAVLSEMVKLKRVIDEFFDHVMVMVEEQAIRQNRLALLEKISKLFLRIADFSKLS
jgi:glycyl-tRNA synthetase beta chain